MPELRSNFEPGTSRWATRRAQWRALGLTDEDMAKPKVAIVNSSSQLAICFSHLDEIARRARRAVEQAGGVAFEVRTAAPSDFITSAGHRGGYILSARDLIACDIEHAVLGPGVCAGLGTANTMHLACEALGMALPGSTPVRANSEPMWRAVEQAGQRIVAMIGEDLRSRDILTPAARSPGAVAIQYLSGASNWVSVNILIVEGVLLTAILLIDPDGLAGIARSLPPQSPPASYPTPPWLPAPQSPRPHRRHQSHPPRPPATPNRRNATLSR